MGRPRGPPSDGRLGPHGVHAGRRSGRVPRLVGPTCGQSTPRFPLGPSGHCPTEARSSPHVGCGRPSAQRADPSADRNKWAFGMLCNRSSLATAAAASRNPTTTRQPSRRRLCLCDSLPACYERVTLGRAAPSRPAVQPAPSLRACVRAGTASRSRAMSSPTVRALRLLAASIAALTHSLTRRPPPFGPQGMAGHGMAVQSTSSARPSTGRAA